jgi:hypothetical protein
MGTWSRYGRQLLDRLTEIEKFLTTKTVVGGPIPLRVWTAAVERAAFSEGYPSLFFALSLTLHLPNW